MKTLGKNLVDILESLDKKDSISVLEISQGEEFKIKDSDNLKLEFYIYGNNMHVTTFSYITNRYNHMSINLKKLNSSYLKWKRENVISNIFMSDEIN